MTKGIRMKTIYTNGTIITMEDGLREVEALCVEAGKILELGKKEGLIEKYKDAKVFDLKGHTLLPAFLDAHSHFSATANALLQVPLDECVSIEEIKEKIKDYIDKNKVSKGEWVIVKGYDQNCLKEKRHITAKDIDEVAGDYLVMIQHMSGHSGIFNTKAMEYLGITKDTKVPKGGHIVVKEGELTGYLEENAYLQYMKLTPMPDMEKLLEAFLKAQEKYASYGITFVQEGMMIKEMIPLYQMLLGKDLLKLDVVGYPQIGVQKDLKECFPEAFQGFYKHFKVGGYKIFLDGSPQGRTAWMLTPYEGEKEYCGYNTMDSKDVLEAVILACKDKKQLLAHCNGDAAAKQYLEALQCAQDKGCKVKSIRPVMIHAQLLRKQQLPMVKKLGVIPSFFVAHVYHWGEVHVENFGLKRASEISPAKSALEKGILFTFHQDTPVIEPDMMETISCAVNRVTKKGRVLGKEECISPYEALKAVTIHAAYQYFEEEQRGSLKEGKVADFVILQENPLVVDPNKLKDIPVLYTIKNGDTIYQNKEKL